MGIEISLGAIPSPRDKRTLSMSMILPEFNTVSRVDYEEVMAPVGRQGKDGTCVAFALVSILEYKTRKEHGDGSYKPLSQRYLFNECDKLDSFATCPSGNGERGTSIHAGLEVLYKTGVCEAEFWPYIGCNPCLDSDCDIGKPKDGADLNAAKYKIKAYAQLENIVSIKRSLMIEGPCIVGVRVYENWKTEEVERTGEIPMPPEGVDPKGIGGHALCVVGYNDDTRMFKIKNSWGIEWGEKGYGSLPYDYMEREFSEAWSITDYIENPSGLIETKEKILDQMGENYVEKN
ncbi:C1 family peptidase [Bacillus thuringiensis]|uniref:C1 family peptidase n=1 Tax=Bacillus thuringiensis TaxID=1428 RepID=UPI000BFE2B82|nr:C1 family peptidase [Bacillus thuringiensis]PGV81986.1 hypothetical protein COD83_05860 [Bacillus thuringiensis]